MKESKKYHYYTWLVTTLLNSKGLTLEQLNRRWMNEAQTRLNKIGPKLRDAGWSIVPCSKILVEQSPNTAEPDEKGPSRSVCYPVL